MRIRAIGPIVAFSLVTICLVFFYLNRTDIELREDVQAYLDRRPVPYTEELRENFIRFLAVRFAPSDQALEVARDEYNEVKSQIPPVLNRAYMGGSLRIRTSVTASVNRFSQVINSDRLFATGELEEFKDQIPIELNKYREHLKAFDLVIQKGPLVSDLNFFPASITLTNEALSLFRLKQLQIAAHFHWTNKQEALRDLVSFNQFLASSLLHPRSAFETSIYFAILRTNLKWAEQLYRTTPRARWSDLLPIGTLVESFRVKATPDLLQGYVMWHELRTMFFFQNSYESNEHANFEAMAIGMPLLYHRNRTVTDHFDLLRSKMWNDCLNAQLKGEANCQELKEFRGSTSIMVNPAGNRVIQVLAENHLFALQRIKKAFDLHAEGLENLKKLESN